MIHYGPAGCFGGPRQPDPPPEPDCFRTGDVWESPQGTRYKVESVRNGRADLVALHTGRTAHRAWDAIGAHSSRPWVRLTSGDRPAGTPWEPHS